MATHLHTWKASRTTQFIAGMILTVLLLLTANHPFFWDTIQLGAKHGLFYYESGFSQLLLPERIDSGHVPAFGMYLALVWMVFGKSLVVSHLAMLPFVWGIVWQGHALVRRYVDSRFLAVSLGLFLCDPTLLSQVTLVSPDIPLVFFFLLALNAVLSDRRVFLALAVFGLFLVSMRGMMVSVAILFLDVYFNVWLCRPKPVVHGLLRRSMLYLPAALLFILYNAYHYAERGWIGFHRDSPWAPAFEGESASGILWNTGLFAWRVIDYGRVFLWLLVIGIVVGKWRSIRADKTVAQIALIFIATTASLLPIVGYGGLTGHRYLLPVYLTFALLAMVLLFRHVARARIRNLLIVLCYAALITGNLWVYPDKIAQGWDATLGHLPYYTQRAAAIAYLDAQGIPLEEVGAAFPLLSPRSTQELSASDATFAEKDLATQEYVLYSNVCNDFTDEEIDALKRDWELVRVWNSVTVDFRLYRRRWER